MNFARTADFVRQGGIISESARDMAARLLRGTAGMAVDALVYAWGKVGCGQVTGGHHRRAMGEPA